MKSHKYPITDDHIHIDPVNGRGLEAAKDFLRAGGTHLFLVTKPSSSFGVLPHTGDEFSLVYEKTIAIADQIRALGITVFVILGVHPAEMTRLSATIPLSETVAIMKRGLDIAASYIGEGKAVALKSGRPHYPVPDEVLSASNEVLSHALTLAADLDCAVQIHAETGPCSDVVGMAEQAGMPPQKVVKHYATPDTPLTPSLLASHPDIPHLARLRRPFTMETDYMDENTRPGAVIGPKSVPRITQKLINEGLISKDDACRIHKETPEMVYGVEIIL
ncbi:MAG: TatD related DNase [Euryarchaeota archaeon ADurb.BinA087]|nr:MAG: TatD related DNase [Euryarchaeota archaeon ADurb.BinA087]HNQ25872.1 TatD family hydrolase [Methanoregulaceae archaeon]HQA80167.1 TatD family hydrolase [Methanoregulaceae archaeon]